MRPIHKIAMVCTTFVLAAATGHVMQTAAPEGMRKMGWGTGRKLMTM